MRNASSDRERDRCRSLGAVARRQATSTPTTAATTRHADHVQHGAPAVPTAATIVGRRARGRVPRCRATCGCSDMMLENPLNKLVLLDRLEGQDATRQSAHMGFRCVGRTRSSQALDSQRRRTARRRHRARRARDPVGQGFARWWDFLAGARCDFAPEPGPGVGGVRRAWDWRRIASTSSHGLSRRAAAARRCASKPRYDVLVTNRLVLEPLLELDWYGQSDPARGVGAGLSEAELGLRLRYEFRRDVAPYVGLVHVRSFGRTADFARAAGVDPDDTRLVAGIRVWF